MVDIESKMRNRGPIFRQPKPLRRIEGEPQQGQNPTAPERLSDIIQPDWPSNIRFAITTIDNLPLPYKDRKSVLAYYFWVEDDGEFTMAEKYMGVGKASASALLGKVLDSDDLAKAYEQVDTIIDASNYILKTFSSQRSEVRLLSISQIVTEFVRKEIPEEEIIAMGPEISEMAGGSKKRKSKSSS